MRGLTKNDSLKGKPETGINASVICLQLIIRFPYGAPFEFCLSGLPLSAASHLCTFARGTAAFAPLHFTSRHLLPGSATRHPELASPYTQYSILDTLVSSDQPSL